MPLPTAYHLLRTLAHEDYLRREKGVFVLGEAVGRLTLGGALQNRRSRLEESLVHWRDAIGVPVYFAVYREGEIELVAVADTPPRSSGPLPRQPVTPYSVRDRLTLLERLASMERMQPVVERQEYALGTVCAAIPITAGSGAAATESEGSSAR